MTKKSEDTATQSSLADDFATTMPAWMPDGLEEEAEAAAEDATGGDAVAEPEAEAEVEAEVEAEAGPEVEIAASADAEADPAEEDGPAEDPAELSAAEDAAAPEEEAAAEEDDAIVVLPPKARLPQIEDIVERLTAAIDADELVIDAREVEDITTPVVTAIIAALNSRADKTPPAAVLAPTPAFVDAFSDLGLFQDLMKMEFRQ